MAVVSLPTIRTVISGDNVTTIDKQTQFTLGEKLENLYYLKSTDGNLAIDISKINSGSVVFVPKENSDKNGSFNFSVSNGKGNFSGNYTTTN